MITISIPENLENPEGWISTIIRRSLQKEYWKDKRIKSEILNFENVENELKIEPVPSIYDLFDNPELVQELLNGKSLEELAIEKRISVKTLKTKLRIKHED